MILKELNEEVKRLLKIMEKLRSPEGCPWDRKQDYYSLKPYIIEEAYEVVEALQKDDLSSLKEELGDLLLQIVFEAEIGRERGDFDLKDVFTAISEKMIRRHPHIFGEGKANNAEEVMVNWQEIKEQERKKKGLGLTSILEKISRSQPALLQAYDIQLKAAEVGFDWDHLEDVVAKIEEEFAEVKEAMETDNQAKIQDELGDLIFATVNLARFYQINPEVALLDTILKFRERFKHIEVQVERKGQKMEDLPLKELDFYWEEAKKINKKES